MLNKMSLKAKILLVVIPLSTAVFVTSGVVIVQEFQTWKASKSLDLALDLTGALTEYNHQLQTERGKTSLYLNGKTSKEELQKQHHATDSTKEKIQGLSSRFNESIQSSLQGLLNGHDVARSKALTPGTQVADMLQQYTQLVAESIQIQVACSKIASLNGLENRILAITILESSKENFGLLRASLAIALSANQAISNKEVSRLQNFRTAVRISLQSPSLSVSKGTSSRIEEIFKSSSWGDVSSIIDTVTEKSTTGGYGISPALAFERATIIIEQVLSIINDETTIIEGEYHSTANLAFWVLLLTAAVSTIMIFASLAIALLVIRNLINGMDGVSTSLDKSVSTSSTLAADLNDSSQSLSASVTEQAESLQETVASLEEVKSMVSRTAASSEEAKAVSREASNEANDGMRSVNEMGAAMDEISSSNSLVQSKVEESNANLQQIIKVIREIGSRTKVINDIVFQTKLLSFNASVEAARAGLHGKGFAVVAEEVGNLARMSGEAAREIGTLLHDGSQKVETIISESKEQVGTIVLSSKSKIDSGLVSSKKCSDFFIRIIDKVGKIDESILEIARASHEQSQGINEISRAMNQLDITTQSNRKGTEKASRIASVLKSQSVEVSRHVHTLQSIITGDSKETESKTIPQSNGPEIIASLGSASKPTPKTSSNVLPFPENRRQDGELQTDQINAVR